MSILGLACSLDLSLFITGYSPTLSGWWLAECPAAGSRGSSFIDFLLVLAAWAVSQVLRTVGCHWACTDRHAAMNTKQAQHVTVATARAPVGRNALFHLRLYGTVSFWIKINLSLVLNTFNTRQNEWIVMSCVREAVRRGCNMFWADFSYIWQWSQWLVWENNPQTLWLICSEEHWETLDFSNLTVPSRWP